MPFSKESSLFNLVHLKLSKKFAGLGFLLLFCMPLASDILLGLIGDSLSIFAYFLTESSFFVSVITALLVLFVLLFFSLKFVVSLTVLFVFLSKIIILS